jgi:hypothetical protein
MIDVISELRRQLDPLLAPKRFVITDGDLLNSIDDGQYGRLEYRAEFRGRRLVHLSLLQVPNQQTITAQLWSRDEYTVSLPDTAADMTAIHRQVWHYDPATDLGDLTSEIVREVAGWLEQNESTKEGGDVGSPTDRLRQIIERLRTALTGVAERELPDDPLPCFCVRYTFGVHDEWCQDARAALADTEP